MSRSLLFLLLAAQVPLFSQFGSQSPVPGIPRPHLGKKGAEAKTPTQSSTGKLTKLDEKTLVVDIPDGRVLEFKRTETTKFLRDKQEIKAAELKPGNRVTVESTEDQEGYLYAVNVNLEKDGPPEGAPEKAAEAGGPPPAEGSGRAEGNIPAAAVDSSEPGPPKLKRGRPVERPDSDLEEDAAAPATPGKPAERAEAVPADEQTPDIDPLIEKARQTTATFTEKLPNYVCKEFMARYASSSRPADWKALDVVSTSLVYEGGRESYRDISINGKPFKKGMEEMSGAWSTGEFGTTLLDLFAPWTAAEFHLRRAAAIGGVEARVYDFQVDHAHSRWKVQMASQSMMPAYNGAVWIEPKTGRVLRLEMQARGLPKEFPVDTVESAVDYESVMIGGAKFLLPTHAETLACQRGSSDCSRNAIDFRNYHKFEATSDVTFTSEK